PAKIEIRDKALKITDSYMRQDQAIKIQYASKFASTANYWKKWIGESQGLKKSNAVAVKKSFEQEFLKRAKDQNKMDEYGQLLSSFEQLYTEITPLALARDYFQEIVLRNSELLSFGFRMYQLENAYNRLGEQAFNDRRDNLLNQLENAYNRLGEKAFKDRIDNLLNQLESAYKNYNKNVDQDVFEAIVELYGTKSPKELTPMAIQNINYSDLTYEIYAKSALTSYEKVKELLAGSGAEVSAKLNKDVGYKLAKLLSNHYFDSI